MGMAVGMVAVLLAQTLVIFMDMMVEAPVEEEVGDTPTTFLRKIIVVEMGEEEKYESGHGRR